MNMTVIIPVYNAARTLDQCLNALSASTRLPDETIIVDDHSTDGLGGLKRQNNTQIIRIADRSHGPAFARNRGAEAASGDILIFLDADIAVHQDTLARIEKIFIKNREIAALFGSYDDNPPEPGLATQYKNLFHHYVHQHGNREASTFWAGCGAIQCDVFRALGGFDESYTRPSIEDIELGSRLRRHGHTVRLYPDIQVTHLKHWTLYNVIYTDIFCRAVPWTQLIRRNRRIPLDLNLDRRSRYSASATLSGFGFFLGGLFVHLVWIGVPISLGILAGLNIDLYRFFWK